MVQSKDYKQPPLDGLLLEACLLHFRIVWDFFYGSDVNDGLTMQAFLSNDALKLRRPKQPRRLREIRQSLNVTLAHLNRKRIDPKFKVQEVHMVDIALIRKHTEDLFNGFVGALSAAQKAALVNRLAFQISELCHVNAIATLQIWRSVIGLWKPSQSHHAQGVHQDQALVPRACAKRACPEPDDQWRRHTAPHLERQTA
jgi:hypothetical protein